MPTRVESSLKVVLQILLVLVVLTTIHFYVLRMPLPTIQFVIMMSVTATNGFESYVIILMNSSDIDDNFATHQRTHKLDL